MIMSVAALLAINLFTSIAHQFRYTFIYSVFEIESSALSLFISVDFEIHPQIVEAIRLG